MDFVFLTTFLTTVFSGESMNPAKNDLFRETVRVRVLNRLFRDHGSDQRQIIYGGNTENMFEKLPAQVLPQ